MNIPGLRSPHARVSGLVYFGRMLDKIRLHAEGKLPPDYVENLGTGFDERCVTFLGVDYEELKSRVLQGGSDEEILEWCYENGAPTEEEIEIWSEFMRKRGWRDDASERLEFRLKEAGLPLDGTIATMFELIDRDEGMTSCF